MDTVAADLAAGERAWGAAGAAGDLPWASAYLCIQAVTLASQAAGSVVATGTLAESGNGTGQFSYTGAPTDRLRIQYGNGTVNEFTVTMLNGASLEGYFDNDHGLAFRFVNPGNSDFTVTSNRSGNNGSGSMAGTFTLQGVVHTANVTRTSTFTAMVDSGYAEGTHQDALQGSVTAPGLSVTVNETRWSRYVVYMGTQTQNVIRTANDTWTVDGVAYDFLGAETRRAVVNTRPGDLEYWMANGTVRRNGQAVGGLQLEQDAVSLRFVLDVSGQRRVLETYARQ